MYKNSVNIASTSGGGRSRIGAKKELYIFLWYLANTNTFREISNLFGISKSAAWYTIRRVSEWLITIGHNYIKWPSIEQMENVALKFEALKGISNVIGAIDCSHIKLKAPRENQQSYSNRKHFYSIHL